MGGAEKWMHETASRIKKHEEVFIFSVAPQIADIYGQIVLKRKFEKRTKEKIENSMSLSWSSFLPFSYSWKSARKYFQKARIIYAKYEVLELSIIFYFVGFPGIKKTIAGIHSPFIYPIPDSFLGKLHNVVYESFFSKYILGSMKKVHVLNKKDEKTMQSTFNLKNVVYVPNGVELPNTKVVVRKSNDKLLHILFVGELSKRKGLDILIDLIQKSPPEYIFSIAGDGPYKAAIQKLSEEKENCIYKGFVTKKEMDTLYSENDILLLPSRAESMSLAVLEALSYGMIIVDSKEVSLDLEKNIEYSVDNNSSEYFKVFRKIFFEKQKNKLNNQLIRNYFKDNFFSDVTYPKLFERIFGLTI